MTTRCPRCLLQQRVCLCAEIPTVATQTRVVIVRHHTEQHRSSNTGRLAHLALPNSVQLSSNGLTIGFLLTKTGGRYQAAEDELPNGNVLSFNNNAALDFDVLGALPGLQQSILPGDFIVVYNLGPGFNPANAYVMGNAAKVRAVAGNTITMETNPFANAVPIMSSPTSRFQVVSGTVNYSCDLAAGTLTRHEARGAIVEVQDAPLDGGTSALIATNVKACAFNNVALANTHTALVEISVTLQRPGPDGPVTLFHQVHVDNTP